jgi:aminoglycoside 3-N-acetyltransferase
LGPHNTSDHKASRASKARCFSETAPVSENNPAPPTDRPGPFTADDVARDLRSLGVNAGSTIIVHSSLSSLGYVVGGARAVVIALTEVLGPQGTLVVPTHSSELSDPKNWSRPPIPEAWWPTVRAGMPAYDPLLTTTRQMGAVAEMVRHLPGSLRSSHPRMSFAALGPHADFITSGHDLEDSFGEHSPLARLYDLEAKVVLLGVGHGNNTTLHLAESRAPAMRPTVTEGAPMMVNGQRQWVTYETIEYDVDDFEQVGAALKNAGLETNGLVGGAPSTIMPVKPVVDFAKVWFAQHRTWKDTSPS